MIFVYIQNIRNKQNKKIGSKQFINKNYKNNGFCRGSTNTDGNKNYEIHNFCLYTK